MRTLILILALAITASAQDSTSDWKVLKELTFDLQSYPGLRMETKARAIARGDERVRLVMRVEFPYGSPADLFRSVVPHGVDPSSVARVEGGLELNCSTLTVKPKGGTADVYQFNGKQVKSKESAFNLPSGNLLASYFCEQGPAPTTAPKLKPSN